LYFCFVKNIHPVQKQLLHLLEKQQETPLTIRELQNSLDISSPSVVHYHLQQLEKKGYLKRNPQNSKDYTLLNNPEKPIVYLNKFGMAQCGPGGFILDGTPVDKIPIASRLLKFSAEDAFIVEARGDSMQPKIYAGDLIIAKKQTYASHGDIVVCMHDSEALIKQYIQDPTGVAILASLNPKYQPYIANHTTKIEGVVKNILHYD
jgi:repressor LexA